MQLSLRGYAAHRGCSHEQVRNAIKAGKLKGAVARKKKGKRLDFLIDVNVADQEWPHDRPEAHVSKSSEIYSNSRAARESYAAKLAKLEYDKRSGKLADLDEVKAAWQDAAAKVRTSVMAVASKMRQRLPEFSEAQYNILENFLRESLMHLSKIEIKGDE